MYGSVIDPFKCGAFILRSFLTKSPFVAYYENRAKRFIKRQKGLIEMYNDDMKVSDRISDSLLRKMLDSSRSVEAMQNMDGDCKDGCGTNAGSRWRLKGYPLASVFAPLQDFTNIYDLDMALEQGTMFAELDLPFMGRTVSKGGTCRG